MSDAIFAVSFNSDTSDEETDTSSGQVLCNGHTDTPQQKLRTSMAEKTTFDTVPITNGNAFEESGQDDTCEILVHADSGIITCEVPDAVVDVEIISEEMEQDKSVGDTIKSDDACFSFTIECSESSESTQDECISDKMKQSTEHVVSSAEEKANFSASSRELFTQLDASEQDKKVEMSSEQLCNKEELSTQQLTHSNMEELYSQTNHAEQHEVSDVNIGSKKDDELEKSKEISVDKCKGENHIDNSNVCDDDKVQKKDNMDLLHDKCDVTPVQLLHNKEDNDDKVELLHNKYDTVDSGDFLHTTRPGHGVRVLAEDDGSRAYEKTTTFIAGDRQSTDELIKRILAESRGEVYTPRREVATTRLAHEGDMLSRRHEVPSADQDDEGEVLTSRHDVTRPRGGHESQEETIPRRLELTRMSAEQDDNVQYETTHLARKSRDDLQQHKVTQHEEQKELSLLERRLASMTRSNDPRCPDYLEESYEETYQTRRGGTPKYYDDVYDNESQESSGYRGRRFRSGLMRKQQALFQADDWSDEEQERRRQAEVEYIPDEEFVPQKAEDTDRVVQERTEEIRKVVDNQSSVLERLKSASDSFDEISNEIKEIKQQFLDSEMRRSVILDEIEHERQMMEQEEYERTHSKYEPQRGYTSQRRGHYAQLTKDEDDQEYESKYRPVRNSQAQRTIELDKELESDRLGRGGLSGLAIGGMDNYRSKLSRGLDTEFSTSSYLSSYGLEKKGKSQFLDEDMDADIGKGSYNRGRLTRTYGGLSDSEALDNNEPYRSPNLPSYRKYDYDPKSYETKSYESKSYQPNSYESPPYKSGYSQRSSHSSSHSLSRAKTLDSAFDTSSLDRSWTKYKPAPTESHFSSRFLNKVREKKASGEEIKRDKPFSSRFLGKSFDVSSTPSFARPSFKARKEHSSEKTESETKVEEKKEES